MQIEEKSIDSKEASGPLVLIQAIVNTRYGRTHEDEWKSPLQLHEWLCLHHFLAEDVHISQGDLRRMIDVREGLRNLLRVNNAMPLDVEQLTTLNLLAKHAPLVVHFQPNGQFSALLPDSEGIDGVIGHLLGIVFTAMQNGTWSRLKACRNERCQKAFYDTSKNGSGTWCSMAVCGSRIKARAYRKRKQEEVEGKNVSTHE